MIDEDWELGGSRDNEPDIGIDIELGSVCEDDWDVDGKIEVV